MLSKKGRRKGYARIIMKAVLLIAVMVVIDTALAGIDNADIKELQSQGKSISEAVEYLLEVRGER